MVVTMPAADAALAQSMAVKKAAMVNDFLPICRMIAVAGRFAAATLAPIW
jgi:hypothetical protein